VYVTIIKFLTLILFCAARRVVKELYGRMRIEMMEKKQVSSDML
jgi:hypothetical protein